MEFDTDRLWQGVHDDAPRDEHGRPIHPDDDKDYPICGYPKTDAVDTTKGAKREDYPFCLRRAGWGTDRPTERGGICSTHGGAGGAPEGWANGSARHLMYSKRMNDDDRDAFKKLVDVGDGEHVPIDEFRRTLTNMIAFEEMRLTRAIGIHPDVDQIAMFECPRCGEKYRRSVADDDAGAVSNCRGQIRVAPRTLEPCDYSGDLKKIPGKAWVDFGDDSVERKQAHIARLIKILNQIAGGETVNVKGDHDVTVGGDGDPVEVNITSVGVDLPDDAQVGTEDDDGDE